jgi:transcriptional regulator with XRE-family HTH domain
MAEHGRIGVVDDPRPASVEVNGDELRERRQLAGYTLVDFAEICGLSFQFLSEVERGTKRVSPPNYARICDALGITDRKELLKVAD